MCTRQDLVLAHVQPLDIDLTREGKALPCPAQAAPAPPGRRPYLQAGRLRGWVSISNVCEAVATRWHLSWDYETLGGRRAAAVFSTTKP